MLFQEPILQWLLQNGGFMDSQVFILNEKRNVTLTAYLQDDSQEFWRAKKRPAVVIFRVGRMPTARIGRRTRWHRSICGQAIIRLCCGIP